MPVVPDYRHLLRLSDDVGLFEHASGPLPRRRHGYCLDDVARALVVVGRQPQPDPALIRLQEVMLAFVAHAQDGGRFRNRLGYDRRWQDEPAVGDWWGRALWGLGTTAVRAGSRWMRAQARAMFELGAVHRSPDQRAMVFAGLGAAEILADHPGDEPARELLRSAVATVGPIPVVDGWPWPEPRLRYANAAVADVLIAAGSLLREPEVLADGLRLLDWLVRLQTHRGHLSVVPVAGWGPGDGPPGFDQQPIEVAALADACARAHSVTGADRWADALALTHGWFLGSNDAGLPLVDQETGGCGDGLESAGVSANQGAESTLALLSTMQHASRPAVVVLGAGAA
jgi:hypothetical protein